MSTASIYCSSYGYTFQNFLTAWLFFHNQTFLKQRCTFPQAWLHSTAFVLVFQVHKKKLQVWEAMTISTAVCIASMHVAVAMLMTNFFVYKNWDFKTNTKILRVIITWLQYKRWKFGNLSFQQLTKCFSTTSWSCNYTHFTTLQ